MRVSSGYPENHSTHIEMEQLTCPESQAQRHLNNVTKNSEEQMISTAVHA
jgi:hypothetical protein